MKTLEVALDDWCLFCKHIELETMRAGYTPIVIHRCKHTNFCRDVLCAYEESKTEASE